VAAGVGPTDPLRSIAAGDLLPAARRAAEAAGVTRLADVTRLDKIGLPVWQAVRPWSRALSVHQGKGATHPDAMIGALLEAIESDAAERFEQEALRCSFDALPEKCRAGDIGDFAAHRDQPPPADRPVGWVEAERLTGSAKLYLPMPLVSLDFTRWSGSRFDRASNGIASGASRAEAVVASLHELIERDAVVEWQELDIADRIDWVVAPATIPFDWYAEIGERLSSIGAVLRCYLVPSLTGTPVFACEINDPEKEAAPFRTTNGRGAHPLPEIALFRALAEAIQARATFIAGARDDLYPWRYAAKETALTVAFAPPPPPGHDLIDFEAVRSGPNTLETLVGVLDGAGYCLSACVTLAEPEGLCVVRSFVCGLGSISRRRRPPVQ
jgi:ribosomal protein S12 methylthiotransferase accessory factor